ncbi:hypothetical protein [Streptomyces sp. TRM64462]|uniref:hypothetical protein n=1 Tax=Streptomyces sp. TRM64462 TaxID=2741726 RepID=UPI0015861C72|nr:hypothetical protein [Streptomyces sp. TRM64462]
MLGADEYGHDEGHGQNERTRDAHGKLPAVVIKSGKELRHLTGYAQHLHTLCEIDHASYRLIPHTLLVTWPVNRTPPGTAAAQYDKRNRLLTRTPGGGLIAGATGTVKQRLLTGRHTDVVAALTADGTAVTGSTAARSSEGSTFGPIAPQVEFRSGRPPSCKCDPWMGM